MHVPVGITVGRGCIHPTPKHESPKDVQAAPKFFYFMARLLFDGVLKTYILQAAPIFGGVAKAPFSGSTPNKGFHYLQVLLWGLWGAELAWIQGLCYPGFDHNGG
uniref:Uncharacterized protein n=1 Tax=Eutreptiella gymnastica TaxID=73025 RepID=A0A7S1IFR6_9EUGL